MAKETFTSPSPSARRSGLCAQSLWCKPIVPPSHRFSGSARPPVVGTIRAGSRVLHRCRLTPRLPFELRTSLLVRAILLPGPDTNNPLAPGPLAVIVEFWSLIAPGPEGPVKAAAPSAVFSRSPNPPEVVTLAPVPTMLSPLKANSPPLRKNIVSVRGEISICTRRIGRKTVKLRRSLRGLCFYLEGRNWSGQSCCCHAHYDQ